MKTNKLNTQRFFKPALRTAIVLASGLSLMSTQAMADKPMMKHGHHKGPEYAKVVKVVPIYHEVKVSKPVRECWSEPVGRSVRIKHRSDPGAVLAGGLLGGIIGHQFGTGHSKRAATAVGTLIGAQIGAAESHDAYAYSKGVSYHDVCETEHHYHYETKLDGYRVTYSYKGDVYTTRMPYDPGDRIKVNVKVSPAF